MRSTSSSCKEFDGIIANEKTIEKAEECLRLAFLYIDRTVDPPIFRYIPFDDSYEILGWVWKVNGAIKKNIDIDEKELKHLREGVYYVLRFKDGKVVIASDSELEHINLLLKIRSQFLSR